MTVVRPADAERHALHGSEFHAFVAPSRNSATLAAWRLEVAPHTPGVHHRPDREEVLLVLRGSLEAQLDDEVCRVEAGEVLLVRSGTRLAVGGGPDGATVWVTTTAGLTATTDDGEVLRPPWAR